MKDGYTGIVYNAMNLPSSTIDDRSASASVDYVGSITTAKTDKHFLLNFNSKINESTIDSTNIMIVNSNEESCNVNRFLCDNEKSVKVEKYDGLYTNDFYNIRVSEAVTSKGGNRLNEAVNYPFYVPFH